MIQTLHTDENMHNQFVERHPAGDLMQMTGWGEVKQAMGWRCRRVAIAEDEQLVGSVQILFFPVLGTGYTIAYIPRGFVTDYERLDYVEALWEETKRLAREENAIFVKLDPDIDLGEGVAFERLVALGFRHKGFEKGFPYVQPRHRMELTLQTQEEETFQSFQRRTRSKIRTSLKNGITFERGGASGLSCFSELMEETGKRDGFVTRDQTYFEKLYQTLHAAGQAELFFCRLHPTVALQQLENEKSELESVLIETEQKEQKTEKQQIRRLKKLEELNRRLFKVDQSIEEMLHLQQTHPEGKLLSGALFTYAAGKAHYLYGASSDAYRSYLPNYRMQWEMIRYATELKLHTYDFGGVSGYESEEDPYRGLYDFKKLFGTEMKEKIGEFDFVLNPTMYQAYDKGLPLLKKVRRLVMNYF